MHLEVRHTRVAEHPVLVLVGVADLSSVPELHSELARATDRHRGEVVIVDLDGLTALDDTALGIFLGAAGRCRDHGGDLVLVTSSARLAERFARTGLDRAIEVRARVA